MAHAIVIIRLMISSQRISFCLCLFLLSISSYANESAASKESVSRGKYLSDIAGCKSCHTIGSGDIFGGGKVTESPFGDFYSPNISSDKTHGIGKWSLEDFNNALTQGVSPEGQHYYPAFPYPSYQSLMAYDVEALYNYLLATPPSQTPSKPHDIAFPYSIRNILAAWKWLYMDEGKMPQKNADEKQNNGRYLIYAVAHCDQCHSPRTLLGGVDIDERLNGGLYNGSDSNAPSLLPSRGGLKGWSIDDLETYLLLGEDPNGDYVGGAMVDVIDHVTNYLTNEDLRKLSEFILSQ